MPTSQLGEMAKSLKSLRSHPKVTLESLVHANIMFIACNIRLFYKTQLVMKMEVCQAIRIPAMTVVSESASTESIPIMAAMSMLEAKMPSSQAGPLWKRLRRLTGNK